MIQTLEPEQRTSFPIFFLPTEESKKSAEGLIHLHTSVWFSCFLSQSKFNFFLIKIGRFSHKVRGTSTHNPYRIRPVLDVKIPLNATFSAPIFIHNPHEREMQVVEIFTTDCNVRLELDGGIPPEKASKEYWVRHTTYFN